MFLIASLTCLLQTSVSITKKFFIGAIPRPMFSMLHVFRDQKYFHKRAKYFYGIFFPVECG
jgi:hypothetical protein